MSVERERIMRQEMRKSIIHRRSYRVFEADANGCIAIRYHGSYLKGTNLWIVME